MIGSSRIVGGIQAYVSQEEREEMAERQALRNGEQPISLVAYFALLCVGFVAAVFLTSNYFSGPKTIEASLLAFLADAFEVWVFFAFCSRMRESDKSKKK